MSYIDLVRKLFVLRWWEVKITTIHHHGWSAAGTTSIESTNTSIRTTWSQINPWCQSNGVTHWTIGIQCGITLVGWGVAIGRRITRGSAVISWRHSQWLWCLELCSACTFIGFSSSLRRSSRRQGWLSFPEAFEMYIPIYVVTRLFLLLESRLRVVNMYYSI